MGRRAAWALFLLCLLSTSGEAALPVGAQAPAFVAYDVAGNTVWARRWFGRRPILLSFDSVLVTDGLRGLVEAEKALAPFPDTELAVVSVNVDGSAAATVRAFFLAFLPGAKVTLLADDLWAVSRLYGVETIPTRFLIDNAGTVRHVSVGEGREQEESLAAATASLLAGKTLSAGTGAAAPSPFRLYAPATFTKTRAPGVTLAGTAPDGAAVTVRQNGGPPRSVAVKDGVFFPRIPLTLARNVLEVEAVTADGVRESRTLALFREAESGTGIVSDIPPYRFHEEGREAGCADCHEMRPSVEKAVGSDPSANPCLECHREMGNRKVVHGPIAIGGCSSCHRFDGDGPRYSLKAEGAELCFGCHEDARKALVREHRHDPVAEGSCTACHDPHGSTEKFVLRRYVADLCFGCHGDLEPAASAVSVHEPFRHGRCDACHLAHGSDRPDAFLVRPPDGFCLPCHRKLEETGHSHPDREPGRKVLPEDVALDNGGRFTCLSCHDPHEATGKKLLRGGGCTRCHASGG